MSFEGDTYADEDLSAILARHSKTPAPRRKLTRTTGRPEWDSLYEQAGNDNDVDPDLLLEQGRQETINFNPSVMSGRLNSPKGARGAGQFLADTAREYGLKVDNQIDERTDTAKSINAQARMMRKLLDRHNGNEEAALAAYNSGSNLGTQRALRNRNRIPETRGYVDNILGKYRKSEPTYSEDYLSSILSKYQPAISPQDTPAASAAVFPQPAGQVAPSNPQVSTPPRTLPQQGGMTGTLHLDPRIAPRVPDGAPRPFAPGEWVDNPDGSWSSEISQTVMGDPSFNNGRPTVIPGMWLVNGKPQRVSEDQAIEYAKQSGLSFPSFNSLEEAEKFANDRESVWQGVKPQDAAKIAPLWTRTDPTANLQSAPTSPVISNSDRTDEFAPPSPSYTAEQQKYSQIDTVGRQAVEANRLGRVAQAKQRRQQAAQRAQQGVTADDLQKYLGLDVTTFNGLSPENRRKAATTALSWKTAGATPTSSEQRNFRNSLGASAPSITDIRERDNALIQQVMPTPTLADTSQAADRVASQNTRINKIITEETNRQGAGLKPFDERVRTRLQSEGMNLPQDGGTASPAEKVQILHRLKYTPEQIRGFGLNPSLSPPTVHTGGGEQVDTSIGGIYKEIFGQGYEAAKRGGRGVTSVAAGVGGDIADLVYSLSAKVARTVGATSAADQYERLAQVVNSDVIAWDNDTQRQKVLDAAVRSAKGESKNALGTGAEFVIENAPRQAAQIVKLMALGELFGAAGYHPSMTALFGIQSAIDNRNEPVKKQLQEFATSLAMGKVIQATGSFGRVPAGGAFGLLSAGEAYARGERDPQKLAGHTILGAATGAALADPEGIKAREIPERTAGYLVKMDALPEWAKDNLADVAKYGKGVVLSSDGRAVSVYADPNTGEVFGNALTPEQARQYDPSVVTGKARPVRDAKFIDSAEFDRLAQALNIQVPEAQPRLTSGIEPTVAEEKDITPTMPSQSAQGQPEPSEDTQAASVHPQPITEPQQAIWHNAEGDMPVTVTGDLGEQNGKRFVSIAESKTGVPLDEIELKGESPDEIKEQATVDNQSSIPNEAADVGASAPRTVSHPDPEIDGKSIVAETQDGRVIVPNPSNVSGVSVVKNRRGINVPDLPKNQGQEEAAVNPTSPASRQLPTEVAPVKSQFAEAFGSAKNAVTDSYVRDAYQRMTSGKKLLFSEKPNTLEGKVQKAFDAGQIKSEDDIRPLVTEHFNPPAAQTEAVRPEVSTNRSVEELNKRLDELVLERRQTQGNVTSGKRRLEQSSLPADEAQGLKNVVAENERRLIDIQVEAHRIQGEIKAKSQAVAPAKSESAPEGNAVVPESGKIKAVEKDYPPGRRLPPEYVYHNTTPDAVEAIESEGLSAGAFSDKPIDFNGQPVWIAAKKSDLPNVQSHQYGNAVSHEPSFVSGYDEQSSPIEISIPPEKLYLVDKRGRVIRRLGQPSKQPTERGAEASPLSKQEQVADSNVIPHAEATFDRIKELVGNSLAEHIFEVDNGGKIVARTKVTTRNGLVATEYLHVNVIQPNGDWEKWREQPSGSFKSVDSGNLGSLRNEYRPEAAKAPRSKQERAQQAKPTAAEVKKNAKAEKVDAKTGLKPSQEDYLAGKLENYAERHYLNTDQYPQAESKDEAISLLEHFAKINKSPLYQRAGKKETIKVPDDGEFTVSNVEQANRLHQKITGQPIEGLPKEKGTRIQVGTKQSTSTPDRTKEDYADYLTSAYGDVRVAAKKSRALLSDIQSRPETAEEYGEKAIHDFEVTVNELEARSKSDIRVGDTIEFEDGLGEKVQRKVTKLEMSNRDTLLGYRVDKPYATGKRKGKVTETNFRGSSNDLVRADDGAVEEKAEESSLKMAVREDFRDATPEDRKALKIPPAWNNVEISNDPNARLIAVGVDAKGRTQRLYSVAHTEAALVEKFIRQREFNSSLPEIMSRIESDLGGKYKEEASVLRLIALSGFRVGGEADTGAKIKAYGASTLRPEHVKIGGDTVSFDFTGKLGVHQQHEITDARLAQDLSARIKAGNDPLFSTSDSRVRAYLHLISENQAFKVHDFRTWNATDAAKGAIENIEPPQTAEEYWQKRDSVGDIAARKIGDTRKIALETYIDPLVFEDWREGAGVEENAQRPKRTRKEASEERDVQPAQEANGRVFRDEPFRQREAEGAQSPLLMASQEAARLRSIQNDTDLISEVRSSVSDNTVIISPHAQELLRRAENENAASFDGQFLNPNQVKDTVKDLDTAAKEMRAKGYDEKDAKKLDKLKHDLIRAARSGKGTVVVAVENAPASAIPHESLHQGSHLGAEGKMLAERHSAENLKELSEHEAAQAWRKHYEGTPQYVNASPALVVEETAATIAGGDYAKLGISDDIATDYLTRWFKSYVEKNGKQSVSEFRRQRDEVKTIIEEARDNYSAERGQPDESVSGVQGERAREAGREPVKVRQESEGQKGVKTPLTSDAKRSTIPNGRLTTKAEDARVQTDEGDSDNRPLPEGESQSASPINPQDEAALIPQLNITIGEVMDRVQSHLEELYSKDEMDVVDMAVVGSYAKGIAKPDSDLDVVVQYVSTEGLREDDIFNYANNDENALYINHVRVDINPITESKSGDVGEWLARHFGHDKNGVIKEEALTGTKNSVTEKERAARGLSPVEKQAYRAIGDAYVDGRNEVESGKIEPRSLAQIIAEKPRPLTATEVGALGYDRARLINQHKATVDAISQAIEAGDDLAISEGNDVLQRLEHELDLNDQALQKGGREQSAAFNARKMLIKEDYSLAALVTRAKARKGEEITSETRAKLDELSKKLEVAETELKEREDTIAKLRAEEGAQRIEREVKRENRRSKRAVSKEVLNKEFAELSHEFGKLAGRFTAGVDPELAIVIGKMAKNRVQAGIIKAEELVDEIYTTTKEHLDLSKRDIRDAISGYGKTSEPSKDAIETQLREAKAQMRLVSALEDAEAGQLPLKSGFQRGTDSAKVKELRTQVDKIIKEQGLRAEKEKLSESARLRKQISTLDAKIADARKGIFPTKVAKEKSTLEAEHLKAERDLLQKQFNELRPKNPPKPPDPMVAVKTRLNKQIGEFERQLREKDYVKSTPRPQVMYDAEAARLRTKRNALRQQIDQEILKQEKTSVASIALKWRRAILLSSVRTLGKLTGAATLRNVTTPIEELFGVPLSIVMPKLASKAPREGGASIVAEAKAVKQFFEKATYSDMWSKMTKGKGSLDVLYGKQSNERMRPILDFFGHLHGALKTQPQRAEFFRSLEKRTRHAITQGIDVTDPEVQLRLGTEAYGDSLRAILMNDNWLTNAYKAFLNSLEKSGAAGKATALTGRFLMPIVKVPTNYAFEAFSHIPPIGAVKGLGRIIISKGVENLTPEQADYVLRAFKKQGLGIALFALGYFLAALAGGYFETGEKRDENDVKEGEIRIFGVTIPHALTHSPALEALQFGATVRRVQEGMNQDSLSAKMKGSLSEGVYAASKGMVEEIPFVDEPTRVGKAIETSKSAKIFAGEMVKSAFVPPDVQFLAKYYDKDKNGDAIARKPQTFMDSIRMGIPSLRKDVPLKVKEKDALKETLVKDIRRGENRDKELREAVASGILTKRESERIVKDASLTKLQYQYKTLLSRDAEMAQKAYERMTPEDKASVLPIRREYLLEQADKKTREKKEIDNDAAFHRNVEEAAKTDPQGAAQLLEMRGRRKGLQADRKSRKLESKYGEEVDKQFTDEELNTILKKHGLSPEDRAHGDRTHNRHNLKIDSKSVVHPNIDVDSGVQSEKRDYMRDRPRYYDPPSLLKSMTLTPANDMYRRARRKRLIDRNPDALDRRKTVQN